MKTHETPALHLWPKPCYLCDAKITEVKRYEPRHSKTAPSESVSNRVNFHACGDFGRGGHSFFNSIPKTLMPKSPQAQPRPGAEGSTPPAAQLLDQIQVLKAQAQFFAPDPDGSEPIGLIDTSQLSQDEKESLFIQLHFELLYPHCDFFSHHSNFTKIGTVQLAGKGGRK